MSTVFFSEVDECISTVEREILPSHISVLVNNAGIFWTSFSCTLPNIS
jgi:hypothetical protein